MSDLADYRANYRFQRTEQAKARQSSIAEVVSGFRAKFEPAIAADPTLAAKYDKTPTPISLLPAGERATPLNYAGEELLRSTNPVALINHLDAHPDVMESFKTMTPADVIRTIARLDASLDPPSVPASPATPPRTTTKAPVPPVTLGTKPNDAVDDAEAALASGDVGRYNAIMNRREVAL